MISLDFILLIVVFISFAVTQGLSSNLPTDEKTKQNYQYAAATFGIMSYGILLFLMFRSYMLSQVVYA